MNTKIEKLKSKAKHYAPAIATGAVFGATVSTILVHKKYNPKDEVAIQLPKGVLAKMRDEGKGLAINSNQGWFTLMYYPENPNKS